MDGGTLRFPKDSLRGAAAMLQKKPLPASALAFLRLSACILILSGLFAWLISVSGRFLPHDEQFLGMTANELCSLHGCRIVHFMIHDRVSFGGAVIATGLLYLWLIESPVRRREAWAWWAILLSGIVGFSSFLAYLGYGYLDTWHGLATLALLPCFVLGLACSQRTIAHRGVGFRPDWHGARLGRILLLLTATGMVLAGLTITLVGMTAVFVPQDLAFMGLNIEDLHALNSRLVPLIAHDRAGFGGAVCSCGLALLFTVYFGTPSRSLWFILLAVGAIGFGSAIGVHPAVGYNDPVHLAPAVLGAASYLAGLALTVRPMVLGTSAGVSPQGLTNSKKATIAIPRMASSTATASPRDHRGAM
jgi:hypothetical protein